MQKNQKPSSSAVDRTPLPLVSTLTITLTDSKIVVSPKIKGLGVVLDSSLTFASHISSVCQKANFHIKALCHIRNCLTEDDAKTIASALVGSQLDYCNSLFFWSFQNRHQYTTAYPEHYHSCCYRYHITLIHQQLHWLPIQSRIDYNIAIIAFKILNYGTPAYLADLLQLSSKVAPHWKSLFKSDCSAIIQLSYV